MAQSTEIAALLAEKAVLITYSPLRTEVDWRTVFSIPDGIRVLEIPPRASLDPVQKAWETNTFAGGESTVIFVPGRKFDAAGTRHGQGGGWYDRFLANVPREWLRIGFCYHEQFSEKPLPRASHDQAMDYVVVLDRASGVSTLYSSEGLHD